AACAAWGSNHAMSIRIAARPIALPSINSPTLRRTTGLRRFVRNLPYAPLSTVSIASSPYNAEQCRGKTLAVDSGIVERRGSWPDASHRLPSVIRHHGALSLL